MYHQVCRILLLPHGAAPAPCWPHGHFCCVVAFLLFAASALVVWYFTADHVTSSVLQKWCQPVNPIDCKLHICWAINQRTSKHHRTLTACKPNQFLSAPDSILEKSFPFSFVTIFTTGTHRLKLPAHLQPIWAKLCGTPTPGPEIFVQ
jgi:hypothetical protein